MTNLNVVNPFTLEIISTIKLKTKKQALDLINKSYILHQKDPEGLKKSKRIKILERFYELLKKKQNQFIQISLSEGGKPFSDTTIEMNRALEGIKIGIQAIKNINGEMVPMNLNIASSDKVAFTQKSPIGVVLSISAFNHPINLAIHQIVTAVAAGCPIIYKPALSTPLVSKKIIKLLYKAGLPRDWCTYLVCDNETTAELAKSNQLGHVSFIGSSKVGWGIKKNMAPGVTINLEHGGNAPVIVSKDANLSKAISQIVKAGFYHAGQVCVSAQRIYVHESIIDSFVNQLKKETQFQKVGNPNEKETLIGPIITREANDRIDDWVQKAIKEGATLLCGGNKLKNNCYEPTILLNPSELSLVTREEIFGPIICVYGFSNNKEAIDKANKSPYIFQAAAYTENINEAFMFSNKLFGAAVIINSHPAFRVDWMPFGGQGLSGEGLGGIDYSVKGMLKQKLVIIQH